MTNNNYPQKEFGEVLAYGGLKQVQRLVPKYMFSTPKYPEGKAVITLYIPDNIGYIKVDKNLLKHYLTIEFTDLLIKIKDKQDDMEERQAIAKIINFIDLLRKSEEEKKFIPKSFRLTDSEYTKVKDLMEKLAKLFGFMFYKVLSKTEGDKETLFSARDTMAGNLSQKITKSLLDGFNEGAKGEGN